MIPDLTRARSLIASNSGTCVTGPEPTADAIAHLGGGGNELLLVRKDGTYVSAREDERVTIPTGVDMTSMVSDNGHRGCARLRDKTVRCWGHNSYGELGAGHINRVLVAVDVVAVAP